MSNKRSPGQKPISLWLDKDLLTAIGEALGPKFADRSAYIRQAVVEKLRRDGIPIDEGLALPPRRIGKGGRPTHQANRPDPAGYGSSAGKGTQGSYLNETKISFQGQSPSKATEAARQIVSRASKRGRKP